MASFLLVASAHFLALLSPGPDFFLIARSVLAHGWRTACAVCSGIALANGLFILLAFSGAGLLQDGSPGFLVLQAGGGAYLLYLGALFLRHAGRSALLPVPASGVPSRAIRAFAMGLACGLLNPKNALFYASLAALLGPQLPWPQRLGYGLWMVSVVLGWDLTIAALIGQPQRLRQWNRWLPLLERSCGAVLALAGLLLLGRLVWPR